MSKYEFSFLASIHFSLLYYLGQSVSVSKKFSGYLIVILVAIILLWKAMPIVLWTGGMRIEHVCGRSFNELKFTCRVKIEFGFLSFPFFG